MNVLKKIKDYLIQNRCRQNEIYWGLVFNNAISDSYWLKNKSFSPGRWAAGYPLLYILFRIYNDVKPKSVLEFGLGESTKLLAQYKKHYPDVHFTVVEQDCNWLEFFCNEIYDIKQYSKIVEIEKKQIHGKESYYYKGVLNQISGMKYDFIVVDGPWGSDSFSRYQVVEIARNNLIADNFIIIVDDYERDGEKQTVQELRKVLKGKGIEFKESVYSGDKDSLLICSAKYSFLTSL